MESNKHEYESYLGKYPDTYPGRVAKHIVENESCRECGGQSELCLDFDVLGDLTQVGICLACIDMAIDKIVNDLIKRNGTGHNSVGFNGHRRDHFRNNPEK